MFRRNPHDLGSRPRMLLAYQDAAYASECGRYFRRLGWEVQMVADGNEAHALADRCRPDVIVFDSALADSAWLTSADYRIVLVVDGQHDVSDLPAHDVVVRRDDGPHALADSLFGHSHLSEAI